MVRTRRLARPFFVGALGAVALSTAACAALFGFEPLSADGTDALAPEGSTEAGDTAPSIEAGSKCGELGLPTRPGPSGADSGDPEPIHIAMKLFDFGINDKAKPPGFNLDLVCSPTVDKGSCRTTQNQTTFEKYARDHGSDGVDNAGYGLITYLTYLGSAFRPSEINKRLAGQWYSPRLFSKPTRWLVSVLKHFV